ncbi:hypothetical protein CDL15_Pgr012782 [Punica granatum]|uniref:Uncharacterized protein n=1 Tax=Punica granatum TaxID=22663 RepID=A0A218XFP8_PUNGR|nr:hypothetical protein CDL15_Pgr012782 [Punica granatum]PKI73985.1 hypothetical protein CRG98_005602 [Punica granatum]
MIDKPEPLTEEEALYQANQDYIGDMDPELQNVPFDPSTILPAPPSDLPKIWYDYQRETHVRIRIQCMVYLRKTKPFRMSSRRGSAMDSRRSFRGLKPGSRSRRGPMRCLSEIWMMLRPTVMRIRLWMLFSQGFCHNLCLYVFGSS